MEKKMGCCLGFFCSTAEQALASLWLSLWSHLCHSHLPHFLCLLEMRVLNACLLINSKELALFLLPGS